MVTNIRNPTSNWQGFSAYSTCNVVMQSCSNSMLFLDNLNSASWIVWVVYSLVKNHHILSKLRGRWHDSLSQACGTGLELSTCCDTTQAWTDGKYSNSKLRCFLICIISLVFTSGLKESLWSGMLGAFLRSSCKALTWSPRPEVLGDRLLCTNHKSCSTPSFPLVFVSPRDSRTGHTSSVKAC